MKKVSLWRRLGTRVQLMIICVLAVALAASLTAIIQHERQWRNSSGDLPFALIPPTPTPVPEVSPPNFEEVFIEEPIDTRPLSLLTGIHVDEEDITRRPIAVVINNSVAALPQSGVAEADIIYEVLAEGNTTRLVAIFQSSIPEKIGPVRSARDYFVDFAFNHDAFFVHHGGSPTGYERIRRLLGVNAIDGMHFEGTVFWRDRSFAYWTGNTERRALEHSSFTGRDELLEHINSRDIRGYFNGDIHLNPSYGFSFGAAQSWQERVHSGISKVVIPFSTASNTIFEMDYYTGLFMVSHSRGPWMDESTREQVNVANILIQLTDVRVADHEGRRNVTTVGSGIGYLVRNGQVFNAIWVKNDHTSPMQWFFEDGTPLVLAPGRTWINVLQSSVEPEFHSGIGAGYGI